MHLRSRRATRLGLLRFIAYGAVVAAALAPEGHVGESSGTEHVLIASGRTSQGHIVSLTLKRDQLVAMSLEWFATCEDGTIWGPFSTTYSAGDLHRIGRTIENAWRHPVTRGGSSGRASERLTASLRPG